MSEQRSIRTYDLPNMSYLEHGELITVNLDVLLKLGDLFIRRADGEMMPVLVAGFHTSNGELMNVCKDYVYDDGGEHVKVTPVVYD